MQGLAHPRRVTSVRLNLGAIEKEGSVQSTCVEAQSRPVLDHRPLDLVAGPIPGVLAVAEVSLLVHHASDPPDLVGGHERPQVAVEQMQANPGLQGGPEGDLYAEG